MKLTEFSIQKSLNFLFPPNNTTFPNVNLWGWEIDLALISTSYYLTEIEIKLSSQDWKRDIDKAKWTASYLIRKRQKFVKKFFYAVPDYLLADMPDHVSIETGLIVVSEKGIAILIRDAVSQKGCEKLKQIEVTNLYKKMYYKTLWWDKEKR